DEIVYIAAVIVAVLLLKRSRRSFLTLICMLAVYFACFKLAEYLVSPLQPFGLGNNYPLYKFAVGLNEASFGAFSKEVSLKTFENEAFILDHELRDAETMKMIQEDLSIGPARLLRLFTYKTRIQWTGLWHQFEMLHDIAEAKEFVVLGRSFSSDLLQNCCSKWDNAVRVMLFAAAAVGGFITARRRTVHLTLSVFMLAFMAFSAVMMLIEVQYRYSYFVFPAIVFAALVPFDGKKE
ncbi:MAG: hypothetical protein IKZ78_01730, partial [Firmicutes bacterium]|nr:hypothetical protein [Bacillota bacterium]